MSPLDGSERTVISRLRLRHVSCDPLLARLRASTALAFADLSPPGMSPASVLVVRSLSDPQPGRLRFDHAAVPAIPEWTAAVRARVATLSRRALRPSRDAVDENAEAVLFADQSELLACLARDWLQGNTQRWWWQTLFPRREVTEAVVKAWCERADCIPAAMAQLAPRGDDIAFAHRLQDEAVVALLEAVIAVHAMTALRSALATIMQRPRDDKASRRLEDERTGEAETRADNEAKKHAPWSMRLPSLWMQSLNPVREAFVGVCSCLTAEPQWARGQDFAESARGWASSKARAIYANHARAVSPRADRSGIDASERPAPVWMADSQVGETAQRGIAARQPNSRTRAANDFRSFIEPPKSARRDESPTQSIADGRFARIEDQVAMASPDAIESTSDESRTLQVHSEYGGLLFLVNLAQFLDLYGDCTTPRHPGIALSIWDFLAVAGEGLIGPQLKADPIWKLLARLAGRAAEAAPGRGFRPDSCWRVPSAWVRSAGVDASGDARIRNGRLQIVHAERFALLDVPVRSPHVRRQLARELAVYLREGVLSRDAARRMLRSVPQVIAPGPKFRVRMTLRRWLQWLLPFVRYRLMQALGADTAKDAADVLLRRRALIHITPTRTDARFSLAELPIEVRLAGLDRDPGWVPAAGRSIRFHFE